MTSLATFTLRTESDLLALVPHTLGFHPQDSLVMVVLDAGGRPMCARVDLPEAHAAQEQLGPVVRHLAAAAGRHRATRAFVVAYCADALRAGQGGEALADELVRNGVDVVCGIRADPGRWYPLAALAADPDDPLVHEGEPYDVRAHPLTSEAVVEGHVTLASRHELVASLEPDPALVAPVAAAYDELRPLPRRRERLLREGVWLRRTVQLQARERRRHLAEVSCDWDAGSAARALRDLRHPDLRDLVWCDLTRSRAEAHAEVWRSLLRRAPEGSPERLAAPVAAVLGFSAWLAGHGALAWCAVERALLEEPDNVLAGLVVHALEGAIPPATWRPFDLTTLPLGSPGGLRAHRR